MIRSGARGWQSQDLSGGVSWQRLPIGLPAEASAGPLCA